MDPIRHRHPVGLHVGGHDRSLARRPVTVVVPCRDRPAWLRDCLTALRRELTDTDEVIVVDSASAGGEVARVAHDLGATYLRCERPGVSRARNAGWRQARHGVVIFVDDDVTVAPGWRTELVAGFDDDGVGFVAGRTEASGTVAGEPATVTRIAPAPEIVRGQRGVYGASNNLAIRRDALRQTGGFDERLGPGSRVGAGEDLELLDRILEHGWHGRYRSAAVARHLQWRSAGERRRLQWRYGEGMGARLAALARRDPRLAWALRGELLRLGGVRTAIRRLSGGSGELTVERGFADDSGWIGPVLWRLGAITGFVRGLVLLHPRREGSGT